MRRDASPALTGLLSVALPCSLAACPAPRGPSAAAIAPHTVEIGREGAMLTGVAATPAMMFAALTVGFAGSPPPAASSDASASAASASDASAGDANAGAGTAAGPERASRTVIEARSAGRPDAVAWRAEIDGHSGPLAISRGYVVAALGGTRTVAGLEIQGEPGAALVALDAATGAVAWKLAVDAFGWAVLASIASTPDGVVVGGSYSGTLRIGDRVVGSGGKSDGFAASVTAAGAVRWLIRLGGPGADSVQGVAAAGDRVAIAGTFTEGADLLGQEHMPHDRGSLVSDGFVAELDAAGARRWTQTFGGKGYEAIAGVAIDAAGRVVVAASVRDTVHIAGADHVANGASDGLIAWWSRDGSGGNVTLLGGSDFDGLRAIAAIGERIVVGGFYSGTLRLGDRTLTAGGGDDAFLAELDGSGSVVTAWPVTGPGREEITALSLVPGTGGFIAGIAHTAAASVGGDPLPAPRDPTSGTALVVRGVR